MNKVFLNTIGEKVIVKGGGSSGGNTGGNMGYYSPPTAILRMLWVEFGIFPSSFKIFTSSNTHEIVNTFVGLDCIRAVAYDKKLKISFNGELMEFDTLFQYGGIDLSQYAITQEEYYDLVSNDLPRIIEFSINGVPYKCYEGSTWNGFSMLGDGDYSRFNIMSDYGSILFDGNIISRSSGSVPERLSNVIEEGWNYRATIPFLPSVG